MVQNNHKTLFESIKEIQKSELENEFKWFEDEMKILNGKHIEIKDKHEQQINIKNIMEKWLKRKENKPKELNEINKQTIKQIENIHDNIKLCKSEVGKIKQSKKEINQELL